MLASRTSTTLAGSFPSASSCNSESPSGFVKASLASGFGFLQSNLQTYFRTESAILYKVSIVCDKKERCSKAPRNEVFSDNTNLCSAQYEIFFTVCMLLLSLSVRICSKRIGLVFHQNSVCSINQNFARVHFIFTQTF